MKKLLIELIGTIAGSAVISIAIAQFLLPNELSSGGFSGIATILYYVLNLPIGITMLVLNIPLLLFSCYKVGKGFFLKTVVGTLSLSFFTELFESLGAVTEDKILACVYGGVLTGLGTAILFKSNSSNKTCSKARGSSSFHFTPINYHSYLKLFLLYIPF